MRSRFRNAPRAITRAEILVGLASGVAILAALVPVLGQVGARQFDVESRNNLRRLAQAHECYARDWDDRQFTAVPDDFGEYEGRCDHYYNETGCFPALYLGWSCEGQIGLWHYPMPCDFEGHGTNWCNNRLVTVPLNLDPDYASGSFRLQNARPLHDFLDGRFYDPVFYAPADTRAYDEASVYFDDDCEFPSGGAGPIVPSSYVLSPAAMYHPDVLRPRSEGGFRDPNTFDEGYASPAVNQVRHANLKSRIIEHNWLGNPPPGCNGAYQDAFAIHGCSPYLFNHGADATPVTLFFDGSITALRTGDVAEADRRIREQSGGADGLWSRDTPFGADGYYGAAAIDDTRVSHHILTTGGILGRDRVPVRPGAKQ